MSTARSNPPTRGPRPAVATAPAPAAQLPPVLPEDQPPPVQAWEPQDGLDETTPDAGFQWDGRTLTRLRLAVPVMRDHRIVKAGEFIDVRAVRHQETGRWYGDEAKHVEDLISHGTIAGTRQARERQAETIAVEHARGVHTPAPGWPNGRTDLRALDSDAVVRQWERVLQGGPEAVIARERREARSEATAAADMAKAAEQLARASRVIEVLVTAKERLPQGHVGSSPDEA